jgi:phage tail-like protein
VTDLLLADVDRWPDIFDLERAPESASSTSSSRDLGNPFPFELDAMGKRRLASVLVEMYRQKGTAKGITERDPASSSASTSRPSSPFNADTLVLGES